MLGSPIIAPKIVETPQPVMPMPAATPTPVPPPAFTIPVPTTQIPVQAVMQTSIPQKKNAGVKTLAFVVMFVALGFITFFILKTMYPVEFANIFNGTTQMHASEETVVAETGAVTETGTTGDNAIVVPAGGIGAEVVTGTDQSNEQISGEIDTGTHESATDIPF